MRFLSVHILLVLLFTSQSLASSPLLQKRAVSPNGKIEAIVTADGSLRILCAGKKPVENVPQAMGYIVHVFRRVAFIPNRNDFFLTREHILEKGNLASEAGAHYCIGWPESGKTYGIFLDALGYQSQIDFWTPENFTSDGRYGVAMKDGRVIIFSVDLARAVTESTSLTREEVQELVFDILDSAEDEKTLEEQRLEEIREEHEEDRWKDANAPAREEHEATKRERNDAIAIASDRIFHLVSTEVLGKLMERLVLDEFLMSQFEQRSVEAAKRRPWSKSVGIQDFLSGLVTGIRFLPDNRGVEIKFVTGDKATWRPRALCSAYL